MKIQRKQYLNERVQETSEVLDLKNEFQENRHRERKELISLRAETAKELLKERDKFARNRHAEKLTILKY